jgi:hypothetical protein
MSKKIDGRRVSLAVLEEKRRAAHRLRERGMILPRFLGHPDKRFNIAI